MRRHSLMRSLTPKMAFALLILLMAVVAQGQSLTLSVTPTTATANSVWTFTATWSDEQGAWPEPDSGGICTDDLSGDCAGKRNSKRIV